jgi:hypothetical protein
MIFRLPKKNLLFQWSSNFFPPNEEKAFLDQFLYELIGKKADLRKKTNYQFTNRSRLFFGFYTRINIYWDKNLFAKINFPFRKNITFKLKAKKEFNRTIWYLIIVRPKFKISFLLFRILAKKIVKTLDTLVNIYPEILLLNQKSENPRFYTHLFFDLIEFKELAKTRFLLRAFKFFILIVKNYSRSLIFRKFGLFFREKKIRCYLAVTHSDKKSEFCHLSSSFIAKTSVNEQDLYLLVYLIFIQPSFSPIHGRVNLRIFELFPCISIKSGLSRDEFLLLEPKKISLAQKQFYSCREIKPEVLSSSKLQIEIDKDNVSITKKLPAKRRETLISSTVNPSSKMEIPAGQPTIYDFFNQYLKQFHIAYSTDGKDGWFGSLLHLRTDNYNIETALNKIYRMKAKKSDFEKILDTKFNYPYEILYLDNVSLILKKPEK